MRIIDNGDIKHFYIEETQYTIKINKDKNIMLGENFIFTKLEDFIYFINNLTEIAKKMKEQKNEDSKNIGEKNIT